MWFVAQKIFIMDIEKFIFIYYNIFLLCQQMLYKKLVQWFHRYQNHNNILTNFFYKNMKSKEKPPTL